MKNTIKLTTLTFLLLSVTSCQRYINEDNSIDKPKEDIEEKINSKRNKIEIKFSCNEDGISKYIDDGWKILEEYSEEKICTWKSVPATKDCDMEKDKGCKITKPDRIGEEKIYLLER